jgi:hypothetical protein
MKYSEQDMAALISEVEAQFTEHLTKAEKEQNKKIAKTEDSKENKDNSSKADQSLSKSEQSDESLDYDENDYTEMDTLYSSMSKSEAEAHYKSVKKAIFGEVESSEESSEQEMEKSEKIKDEKKKPEKKLEKAENEIKSDKPEKSETKLSKSEDNLRKENEELKKSINLLTGAFTKFIKGGQAPKRKAITSQIEYIKKSEDEGEKKDEKKEDVTKLDHKEIGIRLSNKIRSGSLEKSEREKINNFYNGSVSLDEIKHLL